MPATFPPETSAAGLPACRPVDRYAVLGQPVAHSQSPFIHAEFARQTGQALDYGRVACPLDGFASTLQSRFASQVSLLTGALPAQYGFRTTGVVDIQTKTGVSSPGAALSLYGGSRGTVQPSFEVGGRLGAVDYFFTGEYLRSNIGIENPTSRFNARNDETNQGRGFAYVSGILNDTTRLTLMTGTAYGDFRIPTRGDQPPGLGLKVNGVSDFDSATLRQRQRQFQQFGILSLQMQTESVDVQTSVFTRYDSLRYSPDPLGDLLFNGQAQAAKRAITSTGIPKGTGWSRPCSIRISLPR